MSTAQRLASRSDRPDDGWPGDAAQAPPEAHQNPPRQPWSIAPAGSPWRALGNLNYRLFFVGQVVSQSGTWLQRIAQAWLVLDLTGSPVALGTVTALQFLPILLFALPAGVAADRLPKRPLLAASLVAQLLQAFVLAGLVFGGTVELGHVYALALWQGIAAALEKPVRQAFVGEMVHGEDLQSAIGLNSSVFSVARIVGPSLGGVTIAVWGVGWCFLLNGVSFLAALVALALMRADRLVPHRRMQPAPLWTQLAQGLAYAAREPTLAPALLVAAIVGTFGYNFNVVLPLLSRYELDAGAVGLGAMQAALGVGALGGALVAASRRAPGPKSAIGGACGLGLLLIAVAASPWYPATLGLLAILGVFSVTYSTTTNSTLQLWSKEEYRGRVLGLYTLLFVGTTPIGATITGALAAACGIRATFAIEGVLCLLGAALGAVALRRTGRARSQELGGGTDVTVLSS